MLKILFKALILFTILVTIIDTNNENNTTPTTTSADDTDDDDYNSYEMTTEIMDKNIDKNETLVETLDIEDEEEEDDEEEDDYEDPDAGEAECTALDVVKNVNLSQFLPEDYEQVKLEPMVKIVPHFDDTWGRFLRVFKWEHKTYRQKEFQQVLNFLISTAYDMSYEVDLEPDCAVAMTKLLKALFHEQIWAFKFFDSQAMLPTGVWGGIISSFGEYDQCLDIKGPEDDGQTVYGKYCMLKLIMPYPLTQSYDKTFEDNVFAAKVKNFTKKYGFGKYAEVNPILKVTEYLNMRKGKFFEFGICIPDQCSPHDIEKQINKFLYPLLRIPVEIQESTCKVKHHPIDLDRFQIFSLLTFTTMTALVLLSTSYELFHKYLKTGDKSGKQLNRILVSFSMITNTSKLIEERSRFTSINTIKLLISLQFVSAHTYFFTAHSFVLKRFNYTVPLQLFYENRYFFVRAKQLGVDSFMVASGILICYKLIGILERSGGKFNYFSYIISRWVKLSVPLFAAILLYYLLPLIGSGPIWPECDQYFQPGCKDWSILLSNFLYYSNFNILSGKYIFGICVHTTWFLSANFQLCLLAPALVIALYKWPKFGIKFNILLILSGILFIISPYFVYHLNTYYEITRLDSFKSLTLAIFAYHMNTLQYVCSFCIGLLAGYAIKNDCSLYVPVMLKNCIQTTITFLSLLSLPLIMMWNNTLNIYNDSPSELNALLFFGLGKFIWSAALGWIWYVCCTGRAETLNRILSIKCIQPFAKLYYLIYLVHFPIIFYRIYSVRQTYTMTDLKTVENIYIDFTLTLIMSYTVHILIVSPAENVIKYFTANDCSKSDKTSDNLSQVLSENNATVSASEERDINNNDVTKL